MEQKSGTGKRNRKMEQEIEKKRNRKMEQKNGTDKRNYGTEKQKRNREMGRNAA